MSLLVLLLGRPAHSQGSGGGIYWHIDPSVRTCSMVIDPALTQAQWETFVRQAGAIITYKSLAPAKPRGKGSFSLGIDYSITPIDQRDPAWINTFTHPDADCPLGDNIELPALRATLGVSRSMEIAGFWAAAPGANYGTVGGSFQYAFLRESARVPATAFRASAVALTGVPDFNFSVYSVGIEASKRIASITPYAGVRQNLAVGTETTAKVNLDREAIPLTQGFLGAAFSVWRLGLTAEYDVSAVNTFALMMGFQSAGKSP
ncbi:MAG TPA: hypothetical protein VFD83_00630, partial [Candidatus Polarisedimenticolia bacterium]|nr:hypothetical protein [Candidatus Polarisedimenticolia bacterium]